MLYYYSNIRCIKCSMSLANVLFTLDKKVNIDCYDKVDYTKYEYCDTSEYVCTTEMTLVKSKNIISTKYEKARFDKVLNNNNLFRINKYYI